MDLNRLLLPERLPRQIVYAGDRHCEIFTLGRRGILQRRRLDGVTLAEGDGKGWPEVAAMLQARETGVILNCDPFIFNIFEFDRLPWSGRLRRDLVDWKLQKIFPENIGAYDHRHFRLDGKRIFSVLVRRSAVEQLEDLFRASRIPLTLIGSSTLEILNRLARRRRRPDFFVEIDEANCSLVFGDAQGRPVYIRKFRVASRLETAAEISRTVQFVKSSSGRASRRVLIVDHRGPEAADALAAELAGEDLSRLDDAAAGGTPYIPGSR
jgi:hypothetical protein